MAMPMPIPMPSPMPPPGFCAALSIALAAWNLAYWSRLPTMPIWERLSSASSTSVGREMFSMMNRGTATPIDASSALSTWASRSPMACWLAARSSTDSPLAASAGPRWPTIRWRRCSATSSVRNCGSVPTSSRSSSGGSTTRRE